MKKLLIFAVLFVFILSSCSKDDDEDTGGTSFLYVTTKYDTDTKGPEGYVLLFDMSDHINTYDNTYVPHSTELNGEDIFWMYDVNNEPVYSTCEKKLYVHKDSNTGLYTNESSCIINFDDLPYSLRNSSARDILVVIYTTSSPYSYTYKEITWGDGDQFELEKIFEKDSETYYRHYEEW